jgi:capsular exopolysaccharide synthesis family protein
VDLRDYLRLLRKGWPIVLACLALGAAAGIGLTLATTKVYQASVQTFVATSNTTTSSADLAQGNTFTQDRVQSYTSIANSPAVTTAVIRDLGLDMTPSQLAAKISADAPLNKVLINLHVTDHDPRTAARLANAVAEHFDTVVENVEQTAADGQPVVKLTVIHPAEVPTSPVKPSKILNIGLGIVIGLLLGVGIVILRDVLDNTVKGPEDFEEFDIPVLGLVPFDKGAVAHPIAFRQDPHGARSEAYRQLRSNMQFVNVDAAPKVIAITSALPGEGKTTTAINLAAALAEAGYKVCLIEADLRRPTLAAALGLVPDVGFTTALIGKVEAIDVLQNAGRNLSVLTCGPVPPNPSELLITDHARKVIEQVAATADYTIIDTAPLLPVADGGDVAALADATLLVSHSGKSTHEQVARSLERLQQVGERPVGTVLNRVRRSRGMYDDSYAYYYAYKPRRAKGSAKAKPAREIIDVELGEPVQTVEPAGDTRWPELSPWPEVTAASVSAEADG